jgi:hypothetical protein
MVQIWLGYLKGLFHLISNGPPHLNMFLKLNNTFILKVFFFINTYMIKVLFMHKISTLNKFKDL